MRMKNVGVLLCLTVLCAAQRRRLEPNSEWDYRTSAEKGYPKGCANLTLVLDNWKFAIMTQVKDLLLNDHMTVLPDYGRIPLLSNALGDLYKEFNALKGFLGELTSKFDNVENFVDDVRAGRRSSPSRAGSCPMSTWLTGPGEGGIVGRPSGRRSRVVVRRVRIPADSYLETTASGNADYTPTVPY